MTLILQDEGIKLRQEGDRATWNTTALKLHLYKNNFTPTTSSVLANFTESTFPGYAAQNILTWGAAAVAAHVSSIQAAANTFTRSTTGAAETVYGYYVTDAAGALLYWAEKDPLGPISMANAGQTYTVTPRLTDQDLST